MLCYKEEVLRVTPEIQPGHMEEIWVYKAMRWIIIFSEDNRY